MRYLEEATPTVMHRDLKPSNVFLTSRGPHARALVADFGLARWLPHSDEVLTAGRTGAPRRCQPK
jgi:serine/threonine protein kinase